MPKDSYRIRRSQTVVCDDCKANIVGPATVYQFESSHVCTICSTKRRVPSPPFPYKYAPLYRPPSFATLPSGKLWVLLERPRSVAGFERRTDLPLSEYPFGVIAFSERLSDADIKAFELKPL